MLGGSDQFTRDWLAIFVAPPAADLHKEYGPRVHITETQALTVAHSHW